MNGLVGELERPAFQAEALLAAALLVGFGLLIGRATATCSKAEQELGQVLGDVNAIRGFLHV